MITSDNTEFQTNIKYPAPRKNILPNTEFRIIMFLQLRGSERVPKIENERLKMDLKQINRELNKLRAQYNKALLNNNRVRACALLTQISNLLAAKRLAAK